MSTAAASQPIVPCPSKYMVAYAKLTMDRDEGIVLQGVYFGGLGSTKDEADNIARECVNGVRGGTIIPKVMMLNGQHQMIEALYEATEKFEKLTGSMNEADSIINKRKR
jgi:hypothetical protein